MEIVTTKTKNGRLMHFQIIDGKKKRISAVTRDKILAEPSEIKTFEGYAYISKKGNFVWFTTDLKIKDNWVGPTNEGNDKTFILKNCYSLVELGVPKKLISSLTSPTWGKIRYTSKITITGRYRLDPLFGSEILNAKFAE